MSFEVKGRRKAHSSPLLIINMRQSYSQNDQSVAIGCVVNYHWTGIRGYFRAHVTLIPWENVDKSHVCERVEVSPHRGRWIKCIHLFSVPENQQALPAFLLSFQHQVQHHDLIMNHKRLRTVAAFIASNSSWLNSWHRSLKQVKTGT